MWWQKYLFSFATYFIKKGLVTMLEWVRHKDVVMCYQFESIKDACPFRLVVITGLKY